MKTSKFIRSLASGAAVAFLLHAQAGAQEVTIGVTLSSTGPAASLGIPEKQTVELLPKTLGGLPARYVVLDDATDPSQAVKNARRFVDAEKVDAIIGSSNVPGSIAIGDVALESKTPQIALAPYAVKPEQLPWVFPLPQTTGIMNTALLEHMKRNGIKTLGFIGYSDAYGESWLKDVQWRADLFGVKLAAVERFARTDTSVTGQALKLAGANPDAILIAASGTPAALPMRALRDRGYRGAFYQTHGVANNDFLRVAGKTGEGTVLPTGAVLVAEQLPDGHASKQVASAYVTSYEAKHGPGSRNVFGAYAHDAYLMLDKAVAIAAKSAKPGTAEFRAALRDALEATADLPVTHGVISVNAKDHAHFDKRGVVLVEIQSDGWKLLK